MAGGKVTPGGAPAATGSKMVAGSKVTGSGSAGAAGSVDDAAKAAGAEAKAASAVEETVTGGGSLKAGGLSFKTELEHTTWMGNKKAVAHRLDASGNIDIAGVKIPFGSESSDGRWTAANDLFKHVSVDDLEKSITRGRADAETLHSWFTSQASNPPYPGAPATDRLRVACSGTINGKPVVTGQDGRLSIGQGVNGENPFISQNQNAIAPDKRGQGPTLISEKVVKTGRARYGEQSKYPNDTIANAHAEVAFIQHVQKAGLIKAGDNVTIPVTGRVVCDNCRVHLPLMAEKTGIRFMTVIDKVDGIVYYWYKGLSKLMPLE